MAEGFLVRERIAAYIPLVATGGTVSDVAVTSGTYRVHAFASVGQTQFQVHTLGRSLAKIDCLIVGGGGGGGGGVGGGGGGGGGVVVLQDLPVQVATYSITVGAGGLGGSQFNTTNQTGLNGDDSVFETFTAQGGGGGGGWTGYPSSTGGSGGGGTSAEPPSSATQRGSNPTATWEFGSSGGLGIDDPVVRLGGGGGGAALPGFAAAELTAGAGGPGVNLTQLFTAAFGHQGWFGGGGGGGAASPVPSALGGAGGQGGGRAGANSSTSPYTKMSPAMANTGGGGGGLYYRFVQNTGEGVRHASNGGSGIVLIRYLLDPTRPR